jgi:2'-5' RNA ligase
MMIRSFIAVDFPETIVKRLAEITQYLQTQTPPGALRWVTVKNLHLTLNFLGDVPKNKMENIKACIQETTRPFAPFEISIEGLGMFPNAKRPRVIWLGVVHDNTLLALHDALEQNLAPLGIKPEKRAYDPHLTVARVSRRAENQAVKEIGQTLSQFRVKSLGPIRVDQIQLYQSDLTPKGPIYTRLLSAPLNAV